mmetsp:Transcript_33723/g.89399  ORF Transcript_33723/g.89399 Transcript_33723/m.89399 type:complete len:216 (+) Transcript_33723:833-1480(+)
MSSMRDFFDSIMREPRASVSAISWGSVGFTTRPATTSGFGASRGATCRGVLSSSSVLAFLPFFWSLSSSFFRFSCRSCLSVIGSWGRSLSSYSRIWRPSPSEESDSLSRSSGMIAPSLPSTGLKMSWLNHRFARCSERSASSVPSSGAATMAPSSSSSACLPFFCRFGAGPSASASRVSPSTVLDAGFCQSRSIARSPSLSSSAESSLSLLCSSY